VRGRIRSASGRWPRLAEEPRVNWSSTEETVLTPHVNPPAVEADPWLLVIDNRTEGLGPLLADALLGRAQALRRARAA
jgi:hypothetical protein